MSLDIPSEENHSRGVSIDIKSLIDNPNQRNIITGKFDKKEIAIESYQYNPHSTEQPEVYQLEIYESDYEFFTVGKWNKEYKSGIKNVISFDLHTQHLDTNKRSQNLYAEDFVDAFMKILNGLNLPVDNLSFHWNPAYSESETGEFIPASTNHSEYEQALRTLPPEKAILETWTGRKIAKKYGLTELVGKVKEEGGAYSGILTRPKKQQK